MYYLLLVAIVFVFLAASMFWHKLETEEYNKIFKRSKK
jgi:nitrogen fixation-related uncharacterized protein